ncbi:MAG TPA: hypothetical protein VHG51_18070, partial [Longimicrobiaceae bacterium]|nr:hypothetical protein [Longimicrobiaceae bacterium]
METTAPGVWRRFLLRIWAAGWRIGAYLLLAAALTVVMFVPVGAAGLASEGAMSFASTAAVLLASLAAGWVMMRWVERRPFGAMGFPLGRAAAG